MQFQMMVSGAFIKPHWDMGDNEQDEVVKRKKGSDASTFRPYKEPVKEKASSKTVESIIAQTFQGQFRNTVCCDGCGDISTTDEPFMYVPVPLPGALDKNFPLFLIPEDPNSPKITFQVKAVNKHGTVGDMRAKMLKQLMAAQIKLEGMDVLIALGSRNATTGFCGSVDRFLASCLIWYAKPTLKFNVSDVLLLGNVVLKCSPSVVLLKLRDFSKASGVEK